MKMLLVAAAVLVQAAASPVESLITDAMSQIDKPREVVARNDAEWGALWKQHAISGAPMKVDFATRTVVAVFLGSRPTAGYGVQITGTRMDGKTVVVEWRERRPTKGQMTAQIITTPVEIATIPKVSGEVRFQKIEP
jgi:hypothetical protein